MNTAILKIENLSAGYGSKPVLAGVNLTVGSRDFLGVTGPNGGGKTTLLKTILGLLPAREGSIEYFRDGRPCKYLRTGYMPQQAQMDRSFPITVRETVLSGMNAERRLLRGFTDEQLRREREMEELLGLDGIARCAIGEISGGQRQRTLLGRAMISRPELLVLDEPDAYIDSFFENRLYTLLEEMNHRCAIIIVSHNLDTIRRNVKSLVSVNGTLESLPL